MVDDATAGEEDVGMGDPACWLGRVCEECGALVEGSRAAPCWRCGSIAGAVDGAWRAPGREAEPDDE